MCNIYVFELIKALKIWGQYYKSYFANVFLQNSLSFVEATKIDNRTGYCARFCFQPEKAITHSIPDSPASALS